MSVENKGAEIGLNGGRRKKRFSHRTKLGCVRCRERRIRCDEQHPSCLNCIKWGAQCLFMYALPGTVTDLPGVQRPWRVKPLPPRLALDPLGCLSVPMPYKTRALMHHFIQVYGDLDRLLLPNTYNSLVQIAAGEPIVFRSMILTAASHYALNRGGLYDYEQTYRFHMAETVHVLNQWLGTLGDSLESLARCTKVITALCVSETCVGDINAANTHLKGLLTFRGLLRDRILGQEDDHAVDELHRLDHSIIIGKTFLSRQWNSSSISAPGASDDTGMKQNKRNGAMGLAPYFMSELASAGQLKKSTKAQRPGMGRKEESSELRVSSLCFCLATAQCFGHVLELWPMRRACQRDIQMQHRTLQVLKRGLLLSTGDVKAGAISGELWFWQAFCGLVGTITFMERNAGYLGHMVTGFEGLESWFTEAVRTWARTSSIKTWEEARGILNSILWLGKCELASYDKLHQLLWDRTVGESQP